MESLRVRYNYYILMQYYDIIMRSSAPAWRGLYRRNRYSLPLYGNSSWPKDVIITLLFRVFRICTHTHTHIIQECACDDIARATCSKNTLVCTHEDATVCCRLHNFNFSGWMSYSENVTVDNYISPHLHHG